MANRGHQMEDDLVDEKPFKVLPWNITDRSTPKGMRVVRFDGDYVLIVWFENHAFVRKNVKADGSKKKCSSPEDLVKLIDVKIFDVFETGTKVFLLEGNGDLMYLRKRNRNTNGLSLKHFEKIRSGARNVLGVPDGFMVLLVISGHWYLNLYGIVDDDLELMQSLKLGSLPVEALNSSCVASTCQATDLDSSLMEALFPNGNSKRKELIVFVGFPTGQTFYFCVSMSQCSDSAAVLLYVSAEPVVGLSLYQDPSTKKYSHVMVVQQSGALVTVSASEKVLKYTTMYLPGKVCCIGVSGTNTVWTGDETVVWQSKVVGNDRGDISLHSSCVPVGNVKFLSCLTFLDHAIALTNENTLLYLRLAQESDATAWKTLSNYATKQDEIADKSEELANLLMAIAREDFEIDAINFARRADLLIDKFGLTVKVNDVNSYPDEVCLGASANRLPFNESGSYFVEGTIENNSGQEISSPVWTLQVTFKLGRVTKLRTTQLSSTFGRNPLKFNFPLRVLDPCDKVSIECRLIAEVNLETGSKWVVLPIGSTVIDVSHFFRPMISAGHRIALRYLASRGQEIQENLRKIAEGYGVGDQADLLMDKSRTEQLNAQIENTAILSLPKHSTHQSVWTNVTRHCLHRCEKTFRSRVKQADSVRNPDGGLEKISSVDILIGSKSVKLTLDTDCTKLEISSCDVALSHAVKASLISLLHLSDDIDEDTSLQTQVQEFMTDFDQEQTETPNVVDLWNKWRQITSQLPL